MNNKRRSRGNAREIWVADCETDPFIRNYIPKPFLWGCFNGKEYKTFEETIDFIEFIAAKKCICYAHNGGRFDWHFLFPYMHFWEDDILLIHNRIAKFKIGNCEFRDSYSILPIPLAAYQKTKIDYTIFKKEYRKKPENWKKINEYLKDDCTDLYNVVSRFIERFGLKLTLASASMKAWSKMTDEEPPKSSASFFELFKKYYYGGRVECFKSGIINKNLFAADINSAYPYAMLFNHPFTVDNYIKKEGKPNKIFEYDFYTVDAIAKGCFPFKDGASLYFPNDNEIRTYNITGWELKTALETNTVKIVKWVSYIHFLKTINFKEYILHHYKIRQECKKKINCLKEGTKEYLDVKSDDLFAKLLLNSLYGKFGSNPNSYKKHIILPANEIPILYDEESEEFKKGFNLSGILGEYCIAERDLEEQEKRFYNVATAASITGFVRAFLWKNICKCEGVVYCDTDCIIAENINALEFGHDLGQWENEGEFDLAGIAGKKLYILRKINIKEGEKKYKKACKGANIPDALIWEIALGNTVIDNPHNPIFSIKKPPYFIHKTLRATAKNFKREKNTEKIRLILDNQREMREYLICTMQEILKEKKWKLEERSILNIYRNLKQKLKGKLK
ncbi:MAG: DNA polymerase [Candidatus Thorarchaeota archaeon]